MGLFHSIFIAEQVGSAHSALHLPGLSRGDKYSLLLNLHWTMDMFHINDYRRNK